MHKFRQKYIGDKAFYKRYLMLAIPMIIQNAITNLVSFLDNIMVGQLGTEQMSGVAIVNQLIFVYNLAVFGRCQRQVYSEHSILAREIIRGICIPSDSSCMQRCLLQQ